MSTVASELTNPVGLREARANLSHYLAAVKNGKTYTLTEHGRPVARLTPVTGQSSYERLIAQGVIAPAARRSDRLDSPVKAQGLVSDLVAEQRR